MAGSRGAIGRYAEAEAHHRQLLEFHPGIGLPYAGPAALYATRRMFVEARPQYAGLSAGLVVRKGTARAGRKAGPEW
jgi:hypothetical protein